MSLALSLLTAFSISTGLLKRRFQVLGNIFTYVLFGFVLISFLLSFFGSPLLLVTAPHSEIISLITIESFLAWFVWKRKNDSVALVPPYSIPIISFTYFFWFLGQGNEPEILSFLCIGLFLQPLLNFAEVGKRYFSKKIVVNVMIFLLTITGLLVYGLSNSVLILVFLYWFTRNILPLGLDKDTSLDHSFPLDNRVVLCSALLLNSEFHFPVLNLAMVATIIGVGTSFILLAKGEFRRKLTLYRRSSEALIVILGIATFGRVTEGMLLFVLSFSIVSYSATLISNWSFKPLYRRAVCLLAFLFSVGFLIGQPTEVINFVVRDASLGGLNNQILFFILPFWFVNFFFWIVADKVTLIKESKIDHLHVVFLLSAIMIGVLISS